MSFHCLFSKILKWLGVSRNEDCHEVDDSFSSVIDFDALFRLDKQEKMVNGVASLYDDKDQEYIDWLQNEIINRQGEMFGLEPDTDLYEILQNEADTLIDKLDHYMPGDYRYDSDYYPDSDI